jgi:hypothetical protein
MHRLWLVCGDMPGGMLDGVQISAARVSGVTLIGVIFAKPIDRLLSRFIPNDLSYA